MKIIPIKYQELYTFVSVRGQVSTKRYLMGTMINTGLHCGDNDKHWSTLFSMACLQIQSTLSQSPKDSEILPDIRTSVYQMCKIEKK